MKKESLKIIQGEDRSFDLRIVQSNGEPYDLTGQTAIKARFKAQDGTVVERVVGTGITVVSLVLGKITVALSAANTALLSEGENQTFEIDIVKAAGTRLVQIDRSYDVIAKI